MIIECPISNVEADWVMWLGGGLSEHPGKPLFRLVSLATFPQKAGKDCLYSGGCTNIETEIQFCINCRGLIYQALLRLSGFDESNPYMSEPQLPMM